MVNILLLKFPAVRTRNTKIQGVWMMVSHLILDITKCQRQSQSSIWDVWFTAAALQGLLQRVGGGFNWLWVEINNKVHSFRVKNTQFVFMKVRTLAKIQVLSYLQVSGMWHGKIFLCEIWGMGAFLEEKLKILHVLLHHNDIICTLESAFGNHIFLNGNTIETQLGSFCLSLPDCFDFPKGMLIFPV